MFWWIFRILEICFFIECSGLSEVIGFWKIIEILLLWVLCKLLFVVVSMFLLLILIWLFGWEVVG